MTAARKKIAGHVVDDTDPTLKIPLYDERVLTFRASRTVDDDDGTGGSTAFVMRQEIITQLNELPKPLYPLLDQEMIEQYGMTEQGDLNVVTYVQYTVDDDEGEVRIDRNIGYTLRDIEEPIFASSELLGQPKPEAVPIAYTQQTLLVFPPIKQDAATDSIEQISYDAMFNEIFNGENHLFYGEFNERRDDDVTLALLALLKCIKGRHVLPTELTLPSSECDDISPADKTGRDT